MQVPAVSDFLERRCQRLCLESDLDGDALDSMNALTDAVGPLTAPQVTPRLNEMGAGARSTTLKPFSSPLSRREGTWRQGRGTLRLLWVR